jgi:hypothetical protein
MGLICVSVYRPVGSSFKQHPKPVSSINGGQFVGHLSDYKLMKKGSVLGSYFTILRIDKCVLELLWKPHVSLLTLRVSTLSFTRPDSERLHSGRRNCQPGGPRFSSLRLQESACERGVLPGCLEPCKLRH